MRDLSFKINKIKKCKRSHKVIPLIECTSRSIQQHGNHNNGAQTIARLDRFFCTNLMSLTLIFKANLKIL